MLDDVKMKAFVTLSVQLSSTSFIVRNFPNYEEFPISNYASTFLNLDCEKQWEFNFIKSESFPVKLITSHKFKLILA